MRYAHVFDGPGADGKPAISPDHARLEPALAEKLATYLSTATVVMNAPGSKQDLVDPSRQVGMAKYTDGEWYWNEELIRYVGEYRLTPNGELIDHARASDFKPAEPTPAQVDALLTHLGVRRP